MRLGHSNDFFTGRLKGTIYVLFAWLVWGPCFIVTSSLWPARSAHAAKPWIALACAPVALIAAALIYKKLFGRKDHVPRL